MTTESKKQQKCMKCRYYIFDGEEKCTWYGKEKNRWKIIHSVEQVLPWWCPLDKEEAIEMGIISEYDRTGRKPRKITEKFIKVVDEEQSGRIRSHEAAKMLDMSLKGYENRRNVYLKKREEPEENEQQQTGRY